jgi:hypothetical protein
MVRRIILGGVLAGILVFNWGFVSHMVLPIGEMGVDLLPDEPAVIGTVRGTVKEPGFYIFPGMKDLMQKSESERSAYAEKLRQGPVGLLIVHPEGRELNMARLLSTEVGTNIASALLAALVLSQVRVDSRYFTRVGLVTLLGVFAFVTVDVPYWNWYYFPTDFVASEAIDHLVGWFLAGLVLAAIVRVPRAKPAD